MAQAARGSWTARSWQEPIRRALWLVAIVALGVLLGMQYLEPDKRVLAVAVATIVFGIAWRLDTLAGIGLMIMVMPYPRGTVFGNSNFALVLLLLVVWLIRVSQKLSPAPRGTPIDVPVVGLLLAYLVSFYNIHGAEGLNFGIQNTELLIVSVLLFYLLVSNVRTQRDLQRLHLFQVVSLTTIMLLAVFELTHPGGTFIPGWIEFTNTTGSEFNTRNIRVGGPFFDFELMAEFCAVNTLLLWFLFMRAKSGARRAVFGALLIFDVFVLFATVTRGAFISLGLGVAYLAFRSRRRLQIVPLTIAAVTIAALIGGMNFYVSHFTRSGDLFARLHETHLVGLVPDSRVDAWKDGWNRMLEHPLIGHGPYYSSMTGTHRWLWPHNGYLYLANLIGLIGLSFFLAILGRLLFLSNQFSDDIRDPNYARAFLLIAQVQLIIFIVDQVKIDFLRNPTYQFEVWLMFAMLVAAHRVASLSETEAGAPQVLPQAA